MDIYGYMWIYPCIQHMWQLYVQVCNPSHSRNKSSPRNFGFAMAQAAQQRSKTGSISAPLAPEPPFPTVRSGSVRSYSHSWSTKMQVL